MNIALIFAGGSGVRMGAGIPKQFLEINSMPVLVHTVRLFQWHTKIDKIYISTLEDYIPYVESLCEEYRLTKVADVIPGGSMTASGPSSPTMSSPRTSRPRRPRATPSPARPASRPSF